MTDSTPSPNQSMDPSRRTLLKTAAVGGALAALPASVRSAQAANVEDAPHVSPWAKTHDRVFLGGEYWANPMEDWQVENGSAVCLSSGGDRNVQLLTHQLTDASQPFEMTVDVERTEDGKNDGGAGFRIGERADINEYRANCFVHDGIAAGVAGGKIVLGDQSVDLPDTHATASTFSLKLQGQPTPNGVQLRLSVSKKEEDAGADPLYLLTEVSAESVLGNVSVVSNLTMSTRKRGGARYAFANWQASGGAFTVDESHRFGPLLWSMYTLNDSRGDDGFVLRMSAFTGPLGEQDNHTVTLQTQADGQWQTVQQADLDTDAWTAMFELKNWDASADVPFRLVYPEHFSNDEVVEHEWTGTIKANPSGRPLRIAAMTCQKDYAFPYEPVANNVARLDADLLYFSGDQLYEDHGGYGVVRRPADRAILNYLRKQYQFGWSFREAMRHAPTICLTDDHDVFQGNIWGEGGEKMADGGTTSDSAGYIQPVKMINVVHLTNTAHHPEPFDPTPIKQGISVYYTDLVYGGVSFAILNDRQFKSAPGNVCEWDGRQDHIRDPNYDISKLDQPGLHLLGDRQEAFLKQWADDWRGHTMKVVLSQTVFSSVVTHHGQYDDYLRADLDCGSWPQTARNRTVELIRQAKALHINGDQHLTTMTQYGSTEQRNGGWSFCTPAIAAGYPRWWRADEMGFSYENRPKHGLPNTGEYTDSFGNLVYVYAVGNPEPESLQHRYEIAQQKASGFGFVTIDTDARTYLCESYRFLVDFDDLKPEDQFPGWPVLIHQNENAGENHIG